jgi:hypothetical protein
VGNFVILFFKDTWHLSKPTLPAPRFKQSHDCLLWYTVVDDIFHNAVTEPLSGKLSKKSPIVPPRTYGTGIIALFYDCRMNFKVTQFRLLSLFRFTIASHLPCYQMTPVSNYGRCCECSDGYYLIRNRRHRKRIRSCATRTVLQRFCRNS